MCGMESGLRQVRFGAPQWGFEHRVPAEFAKCKGNREVAKTAASGTRGSGDRAWMWGLLPFPTWPAPGDALARFWEEEAKASLLALISHRAQGLLRCPGVTKAACPWWVCTGTTQHTKPGPGACWLLALAPSSSSPFFFFLLLLASYPEVL